MASNPSPTVAVLPSAIPSNIAQLTAPLLIGALLNYAFYGILCVQVFVYKVSFHKDKIWIKALVFGIFILETLQVCLGGADIYYWFGSGFGNIYHLGSPYVSPFDTPMIGSLTAFIVQIFFCYRIWILQKNLWPLCLLIGAISAVQLYGGMASGVWLWFIGSAITDVLITVTMTFLLMKARQQEHKFTSDIILNLIWLTMETNGLTAGTALLTLILFIKFPYISIALKVLASELHIYRTLVTGKLYSNALLVTLNNRAYINNQHHNAPNIPASEVTSGSSYSHPQSITLNATQSFGQKSYELKTFSRDQDIEINMHTPMV
ncbi:hypothetical protein L208DRAFT_1459197 [Tricholoma matsutake]|nr:hypothetical protein L208DRAFT_1459197 [Tricholoma matsutake 945]